jgi:hypothetical protein
MFEGKIKNNNNNKRKERKKEKETNKKQSIIALAIEKFPTGKNICNILKGHSIMSLFKA